MRETDQRSPEFILDQQLLDYVSWANGIFEPKNIKIKSVEEFCDGVRFIQLLEVLTNKPLEQKYYIKPTNDFYKSENCLIVIHWMETLGIDVRFTSPTNIVNANKTTILSVFYQIKRKFSNNDRKSFVKKDNRVNNVQKIDYNSQEEITNLKSKNVKIEEELTALKHVVEKQKLALDIFKTNGKGKGDTILMDIENKKKMMKLID